MANFAKDIREAVEDDIILAVNICKFSDYSGESSGKFTAGNLVSNSIIPYKQALQVLDYEYDDGFGGQDCHNIYMWSKDWVYYIHEYDGSTSICSVPRNPTPEP